MSSENNDFLFKVNNISYNIGQNRILNSLDFKIIENQTTFILGDNGSGKSTLLDIITDNIKPSDGSITKKKIRKGSTGVLFDVVPFTPTLKVRELVRLYELIFNIKRPSSIPYIKKLEIHEVFDKKFKVLSLGEKKRVGLFVALLNNPKYLFLDEPFGGIDSNSLNLISSLLFLEQRTTIISSHNWAIAKEKADKILFLYKGRQLTEQLKSPDELLSDEFIPFTGKIILENNDVNHVMINQIIKTDQIVLEYDNKLNIFFDEDMEIKNALDKKSIPYSVSVKNLNDVYNYLIKKNENVEGVN